MVLWIQIGFRLVCGGNKSPRYQTAPYSTTVKINTKNSCSIKNFNKFISTNSFIKCFKRLVKKDKIFSIIHQELDSVIFTTLDFIGSHCFP